MVSEVEKLRKDVDMLQKRVSALEGDFVYEQEEPVTQPVASQQPVADKKPVRKDSNSNALGVVGGVILSLGFIFLIAYAIDQGWISRSLQIILGVLAGSVLTVAGHFLHKKMDLQGSILSAVGIVTAYFSIYSGYVFDAYRAVTGFSFAIASSLLVIVLLFAMLLSYKQNSPILVLEALLLSFIATFMSSFEWLSLVYTSLFVLGFCALVYIKKWTQYAFVGGAITVLMTLINVLRASDVQSFVMIAIFGLSFLLLSLQRENVIGAVASIIGSYVLFLIPLSSDFYSYATLVAGAVCFVLYSFSVANKAHSPLYLIAGIGFLLFWIPQQFDGYLVMNLWIVIAGLLAYAHTRNDETWLESASAMVSLLAGASLLFQTANVYDQVAVITSYFLVSVVAFFVSYHYAVAKKPQTHIYYLAGLLALVLLASFELSKFWITLCWAALAFTSLWLGLQTSRPVPKTAGLILLAVTVGKLFVVDTISLSAGLRIIAYITLGVVLLVGSVVYRKYVSE